MDITTYAILKSKITEIIENNKVVVTAQSNTTINGYQVPDLTVDEVIKLYNGVVNCQPTLVIDATESGHFVLDQADSVGADVNIGFIYYDVMALTYSVENDNVVITYKEFA